MIGNQSSAEVQTLGVGTGRQFQIQDDDLRASLVDDDPRGLGGRRSPTTRRSGSRSRIDRSPCRTIAWSSIRTISIGASLLLVWLTALIKAPANRTKPARK
jgi:hypothetical protein